MRPGLTGLRLALLVALVLAVGACRGTRATRAIITLLPPALPTPESEAPLATPAAPGSMLAVGLGPGVPADLLGHPLAQGLRIDDSGPVVTLALAGTSEGVAARYWLPVTDLFNDATAITSADLGRALRGDVTDWRELGASSAPLQVLLPAEMLDEIAALAGGTLVPDKQTLLSESASASSGGAGIAAAQTPAAGTLPRVKLLPRSQIPAAVELQRGALALLPLDDVDFRVRALPVDGIDLFRGTGTAQQYPLATRVKAVPVDRADGDSLRKQAEDAIAAPLPQPVRLLATGDIIPARCVYERQRRYGDYRHAFLEVAGTLRSADLAVGSLDASISDKGTPIGCRETLSLMAPAESVQGLTYAGIGLLTVAANHAKDCGESACGDAAFLDTLARLDAAGIAHTGGGRNLAEARTATVLTVKGVRFAFLGYDDIASQYYGAGERSPGTAPLDLDTLADDVRAAKARADVVVVMVHWGVEYTPDPSDRQREAARIAVQAGATLVVGNHPHVVQAVEAFPTGFADYALGNFVFDQDWSQETLEGVVMECLFDGPHLRQIGFLPLRIQDMHQPHFLSQEQGRFILDRMQKASVKLLPNR